MGKCLKIFTDARSNSIASSVRIFRQFPAEIIHARDSIRTRVVIHPVWSSRAWFSPPTLSSVAIATTKINCTPRHSLDLEKTFHIVRFVRDRGRVRSRRQDYLWTIRRRRDASVHSVQCVWRGATRENSGRHHLPAWFNSMKRNITQFHQTCTESCVVTAAFVPLWYACSN